MKTYNLDLSARDTLTKREREQLDQAVAVVNSAMRGKEVIELQYQPADSEAQYLYSNERDPLVDNMPALENER